MKRTCLHTITIEDQCSEAKLNTDEQNSCELNRRSPFGKICGTKCSKFHLVEQLFEKRTLDPKDNQFVKSFIRMKQIDQLIAVFLLIFFTSCASSKFVTSDVHPNDVNDLQFFEPFSYITFIEKGNYGSNNDSLSNISKGIIKEAVNSYHDKLPITGEISSADFFDRQNLEEEIGCLCSSASKNKDLRIGLQNLKITPIIDSLLELKGKRFGLITVCTGFTRKKGNYMNEFVKSIVVGVLTAGLILPEPVKSNSTMYALIVDSKNNNVAFFRKISLQDREPLDKNVIKRQIRMLFKGYFWDKE